MGCSSAKLKTANPPLVFNPQPLRTNPDSPSKCHQAENLNRIPEKAIWETRVIIENEHKSIEIAFKQLSHRLKQISYFRLSLDNGIDTKLIGVQSIHRSLRSIKSLNKLSLKCQSSFDSNTVLRTLSCQLKKNAKSLDSFNLNLHPLVEATDKEMKALCSLLSHLCYTSTLVLNFRPTNATLERLNSTLKHLRSLTTLQLAVMSSLHLDAKGIENLVSRFRLLPSLSTLSLKFSFCEGIDNKALQSLSLGLKSLSGLSTLSFTLCFNRTVSSQGIENLLMNLGSLTWISGLDLRIYHCEKVNDTVMESLCTILKQKLTSLSSLTLMLSWYNIGYHTIAELSRCFSDLPFLSSFTLYLRTTISNDRISNKGLEGLTLALQQLKSLSSLHIDFSHCYCIDDQGIKIFSKQLQKLSRLSSLTVAFNFCKGISSKGTCNLFKALSYLTLLMTLRLKFGGCDYILCKITESLYATLKCLNLLSDLELEFDFLLKFDQHDLDEFASQLKSINPSFKLIKMNDLFVKVKLIS